MRASQKGFTLVELMTVLFALSIILTVGIVVVHFICKFW